MTAPIQPPGPLGLYHGVTTPLAVLVAHFLVGAVVGALYKLG